MELDGPSPHNGAESQHQLAKGDGFETSIEMPVDEDDRQLGELLRRANQSLDMHAQELQSREDLTEMSNYHMETLKELAEELEKGSGTGTHGNQDASKVAAELFAPEPAPHRTPLPDTPAQPRVEAASGGDENTYCE